MSPTDASLFDYAHTVGGPALFMTAVTWVVLPLAWFRVVRRRCRRWPARVGAMLGVWLAGFAVAYADVFWIARHTERLCEREAGLRILRTVQVPGVRTVNEVLAWFERDSPRYRTVARPAPTYEYGDEAAPAGYRVRGRRYFVRVRATGERLAELTLFTPGYGWLDRPLSQLAGRSLGCSGPGLGELPFAYRAVIAAAFRPAAPEGERP